ncbi:hypothetical protein KEH51_25055 [[Brevibacterium] frigoritolerans]|uniref:ABC transmembrane type-1 domain-containing protein n=1 Tax=Peribacillus frigoritolerans TaxID=450367 RepID=A0A941J8T4_9BACI|nr:hypothetical protein [Peribacillus frigoritolerans]
MHFRLVFQRLVNERLAFASLIYLLFLVFLSLFARFIIPFDPEAQDLAKIMLAPNGTHWFGTDELGRDIFSRVLLGSQAAIQAGLVAILIPLVVGVPLGILSGYLGGIVDDIFMRVVDAILSFPAILLALGITGALGLV